MRFLDKTIRDIMRLIRETVADDEVAARPGLLQGADPRFKLAGFALLVASSVATKSPAVLAALWLLALGAALASKIGLRFFLARTALFVPLFTLFLALPAITGFVTPGEEVASFSVGTLRVQVTRPGIVSGTLITLRALAAVSLSVLLVLTTRRTALLASLRAFRVPQLFVMTMGMTLRYIHLLLDTAEKGFVAIQSRVGLIRAGKDGRRVVGWNAGSLWLKSYRLQGAVYDAMISRGYSGEPVTLERFRARARDGLLLSISIFILAGTLWLNRFST